MRDFSFSLPTMILLGREQIQNLSEIMKLSITLLTALLPMGSLMAQSEPVHAKGYAAMNAEGQLVPYEFKRRAVGEHDLLVELLYCGICHSDVQEAFNDR